MSEEHPVTEKTDILTRLLLRTGRFYIPVVIAIIQLPFFLGAVLGAIIIQFNAQLTQQQLNQSGVAAFIAILIGYILILVFSLVTTRQAGERLQAWSTRSSNIADPEEERIAWRQVAALPWNYGLASAFIVSLVDIAPVVAYQYYSLKISFDQAVYSFLGGLSAAIIVIVLSLLALERMLIPARRVLLPRKFENQISAGSRFYMLGKLIFIGIALIGITALLIGPIGYRETFKAISEPISSIQIFNELRTQLLGASVVAVIAGLIVTLLLTNSITTPVHSLIETFTKVERGDLTERAQVLSNDEIGELSIYFNRMVSRLDELQQTLEKRVLDRTEQLRVSNEVGRIASTILDPDTVITRVVELITKSFDYYYSAIFLVAENERWAELKDATGTAGAILKARRHRLQINNTSMVGSAIITRQPQVALDVGETAIRFNNPLLPNTRSEIAIPLMMADRVIGVLDVQSIRGADFKPEDISTLQSMANQVAIAIENARLFKEMGQALDELRQANRQYVISAWTDKLKATSMEYTTGSSPASAELETKDIEVKLNLRDENIGSIHLETSADWTAEDQGWVEALATQVAISLENARLVEESQQSALREKLSASIVQKLWSTNSIDGIMQTTVRELGRALEASEATIELKVED